MDLPKKCLFVGIKLLLILTIVNASPNMIQLNNVGDKENLHIAFEPKAERTGKALHNECGATFFSTKCIKIQALSFLEDLSSRSELNILPGLSIVKENSSSNGSSPEEVAAELSRQFPGRPDEKINRFLLYRLQSYLDTHALRYKLLDSDAAVEALENITGERSLKDDASVSRGSGGGLGGGGKKGGGGMGTLLAAALMMKGTLGAAAIGALALLAGKALMTALLSLLLSALIGMKGGGGHKSTTYEIITKPVVSHSHTQSHEEHHEHEHGGYGHHDGYRRAYNYYDQPQPTTN